MSVNNTQVPANICISLELFASFDVVEMWPHRAEMQGGKCTLLIALRNMKKICSK